MTDIHIEGVRSKSDLLQAIAVVVDAFDDVRPTVALEQVVCRRAGAAGYVCEIVDKPAFGAPLVPCPQRGSHERLTDCWLCWSDVMRGAAIEPEVLTDDT